MRLKEQRLWDSMRKALTGFVHTERIENTAGTGRPDVDCLVDGLFTPVELKAVEDVPARPSTPVLGGKDGLSVAQRNWALNWRRYGGRSLVIVGVGKGAARRVFIFNGRQADEINRMSIQQMELAAIGRNWYDLINRLKGEWT